MNKKIILSIAVSILLIGAVLFILLRKEAAQSLPVDIQQNSQVLTQQKTHPYVSLEPGEHITWKDTTSFVTYENNLPGNERIVKINNIQKTSTGYILNVSDFVWGSEGGVMNDGSVEKGLAASLVLVDLRGQADLFISDMSQIKYISYKNTGEQIFLSITPVNFLAHFTDSTCLEDQYGCENLRSVFWHITTEQGGGALIKQEYQP